MRAIGILRTVAAAAFLVILAGTFASSVGATPTPNSAVIHARVYNDCPSSVLTTTNSYPSSIAIDDAVLDCFGFANLHTWRFSDDGVNALQFSNGDNFRFSADLVISGATEGEAGLQLSPWWSPDVDGRFNVRTTDGEIACFGGRMPFYSFTGSYGITYVKGTSIHLQITYIANDLDAANPARIEYQVTYGGMTYSSGYLPFDEGNPAEDPPHGLWGMLTPAYVGGHLQAFLQGGNASAQVAANWTNIEFEALDPQAVAIFPRVYNDCPSSELSIMNGYPALISMHDSVLDCFGFANLHVWRFSDDGGTTAHMFQNNSMLTFGADLVIEGTTTAEAGLDISPWWSPVVDGRLNVRIPDGEIAAFGGRLPFYSFTNEFGIHYAAGMPIHLSMAYMPNGLSEESPATIVYGVEYGGMSYSSGPLPFDMGNPNEDPPHGLWGMLSPAYAGGHFQPQSQGGNPAAEAQAIWTNLTFEEVTPVTVQLDIKPGSCDNPFNTKAKGVLPVAILGSEDLDVSMIDASSLLLEGVSPKMTALEMVEEPTGSACDPDCELAPPDGLTDLVAKFFIEDLAQAINGAGSGEAIPLHLTGNFLDGTPLEGVDCISLVGWVPQNDEPKKLPKFEPLSSPRETVQTVTYTLPSDTAVRLSVFNIAGRLVDVVVDRSEGAGTHVVSWDSSRFPSGVYFYKLQTGNETSTLKTLVIH